MVCLGGGFGFFSMFEKRTDSHLSTPFPLTCHVGHPTQGADNAETQPLEESACDHILRAKTLELGEAWTDSEGSPPSPKPLAELQRGKSTVDIGAADAAEVLEEPTEKSENHEEPPATQPSPEPAGESSMGDEVPDLPATPETPMVTRDDQRALKELSELGIQKPNAKAAPKRRGRPPSKKTPCVLKKPAARAPAKSKKITEEPGESEGEEMVDDTQHYSPSQSPVSPKNLQKNFDAADPSPEHDTAAGRRKAAKRKASDEDDETPKPNEKKKKKKGEVSREDDDGKEDPPKTRKRKQKAADTENPKTTGKRTKKPEDKKDGKIPHDDGSNLVVSKRGSGPRVSFAGRVPPKNEQAKQRHEVMVATYMDQIGPFVTNGSQVEDRCSKQFFVFAN